LAQIHAAVSKKKVKTAYSDTFQFRKYRTKAITSGGYHCKFVDFFEQFLKMVTETDFYMVINGVSTTAG